MSSFRWSPEAVASFEARRKEWERKGLVKVRTHRMKDDPPEPKQKPGPKPKALSVPTLPPAPKLPKARKRSELEIIFEQHVAQLRLPAPEREFKGAVPGREFRLDFAWPDRKVAVEVQGMVHRIKARFKADTEKHCLLVVHGWKVLPVSGDDVRRGRAVQWVESLLRIVEL